MSDSRLPRTMADKSIFPKIEVKLLTSSAKMPKQMSETAAGFDLYNDEIIMLSIAPGKSEIFTTGVSISMQDPDLVALVFIRSSLAFKCNLTLTNGVGVIDSDYQGEIKVKLTNIGDMHVKIEPGVRIAQIVFQYNLTPLMIPVENFGKSSKRGEDGFGSTGE